MQVIYFEPPERQLDIKNITRDKIILFYIHHFKEYYYNAMNSLSFQQTALNARLSIEAYAYIYFLAILMGEFDKIVEKGFEPKIHFNLTKKSEVLFEDTSLIEIYKYNNFLKELYDKLSTREIHVNNYVSYKSLYQPIRYVSEENNKDIGLRKDIFSISNYAEYIIRLLYIKVK